MSDLRAFLRADRRRVNLVNTLALTAFVGAAVLFAGFVMPIGKPVMHQGIIVGLRQEYQDKRIKTLAAVRLADGRNVLVDVKGHPRCAMGSKAAVVQRPALFGQLYDLSPASCMG